MRLVRNRKGDLVALKTVFKTRHGLPLKDDQLRRFREERAILMAVHDHPFIVTMHNAFEDRNCIYFELQHAQHGALSLWITQPLSKHVTRLIAAEATCALAHLHAHSVIYRDLKPENVLVGGEGHILLADFGVSKQLQPSTGGDRASSVGRTAVGTPGYMAPEVIRGLSGSTHSYPVDWWALGLLVTILVTCSEPFEMGTVMDLAKTLVGEKASGENALRSGDDGKSSSKSSSGGGKSSSGESTSDSGGGGSGGSSGGSSGGTSASQLVDQRLTDIFPPNFGDVRAFAKALLTVDPAARLGTAGGAKEVQAHAFFAGIDWERLVQCKLPPPLPGLGSRFDAPVEHHHDVYGESAESKARQRPGARQTG